MKMLLVLSSFLMILSSAAFGGIKDDVSSYSKEGKVILDMIIKKKIDVTKVKSAVDSMTETSTRILKAYANKFPKGKKLLGIVEKEIPKFKNESFEVLEKEWHDLGYFKGKDVGIDIEDEDNEHFTDPIHCVVHPIMTLRAAESYAKKANDKDLQTMKEEISEGLEQMEALAKKL